MANKKIKNLYVCALRFQDYIFRCRVKKSFKRFYWLVRTKIRTSRQRCARCNSLILGDAIILKNNGLRCKKCYPNPINSILKFGEIK